MPTLVHPDLGRIFLPSPRLSYPGAPTCHDPRNVVVATLRRPIWSLNKLFELPDELHPKPDGRGYLSRQLSQRFKDWPSSVFTTELIWASVTPNGRVNEGGIIMSSLCFGPAASVNSLANVMGIALASFVATQTDLSIAVQTRGTTQYEFTTIGLSRAASTVQNYVAPTSLNGTYSVDCYKSFAVTGSGAAYGAALFDSATIATSNMLEEDLFASPANVQNADTLNVTYTTTN